MTQGHFIQMLMDRSEASTCGALDSLGGPQPRIVLRRQPIHEQRRIDIQVLDRCVVRAAAPCRLEHCIKQNRVTARLQKPQLNHVAINVEDTVVESCRLYIALPASSPLLVMGPSTML